ncbi:hypothetical protein D030_2600A, partial [Vibrio parahaemolyticus AQ3810]
MSPLSTAFS